MDAADAIAAKQAQPPAEVAALRSRGTLCVHKKHYMPAFKEVPPRPAEAKHDDLKWPKIEKTLISDAKTRRPRMVLLGDSITEGWRGTSKGEKKSDYKKGPELLAKEFGEFAPLPLAIAGDQTTHLLWRLGHQGFPTDPPPEYVTVMIGTNDLGSAVKNVKGGWSDGACVSDENVEAGPCTPFPFLLALEPFCP